jgi:glucose/arabinose dehydrogenase/cytochrome c5
MSSQANHHARRRWPLFAGAAISLMAAGALAQPGAKPAAPAPAAAPAAPVACPGDNGGLKLSPGFCATVFADDLGHVRHMAIARDGTLYANTWSGQYYANSPPPPGGFLIALKDNRHAGKADQVTRFGDTAADGSAGGTGVALYGGHVYAEENDKIVRYALPAGGGAPTGKPEVVLSGMPLGGDHPMHPFVIDAKGQIFVDMGSATNSCQAKNRALEVPGADPCTEKETRAGIWRYDAGKLGQKFSPAERYASGIRNGEGFAFDAAGRLFVTQHGRDQLLQNWPKLYPDAKRATELPAEQVMQLTQGADYGWPECYDDPFQKKLVLAPEYGGDGGKKVGVCAQRTAPVAAYPAHWAPNDLAIYSGKGFPAPYRGAFIAFHGSWNRAPAPQEGYNVVFQPMAAGKAAGRYIVFADGFAGGAKDPGKAAHRPTGLAIGPDGALYISDDVKGRIWRVTYRGPANVTAIAAASAPRAQAGAAAAPAASAAALPVPAGATRAQVEQGGKIFHSQTCVGCHGGDGKGTPQGPDLTSGKWLWGDGSLASIRSTIDKGVPMPKRYTGAMPAKGGAQLTDRQLSDVAAWVWAIGHQHK